MVGLDTQTNHIKRCGTVKMDPTTSVSSTVQRPGRKTQNDSAGFRKGVGEEGGSGKRGGRGGEMAYVFEAVSDSFSPRRMGEEEKEQERRERTLSHTGTDRTCCQAGPASL